MTDTPYPPQYFSGELLSQAATYVWYRFCPVTGGFMYSYAYTDVGTVVIQSRDRYFHMCTRSLIE